MVKKHDGYRTRIAERSNRGHTKPMVRETGIAVEEVLAHLAEQPDSLEELLAAYPMLTKDDVRACLVYAEELVAAKGRGMTRTHQARRRRKKTKEDYRAFKSAAGGWREVDTDRLIADIHAARRTSNRPLLDV